MNRTKIEYLDYTWNPTHGCSPVSEGCANCWAKIMSKRLAAMGERGYDPKDPFRPTVCPWKLDEPLRLEKPAVIGVSFMGDLFHKDFLHYTYEDENTITINHLFLIMEKCPQHTFLILTKRPEDLKGFCSWRPPIPKNIWLGVTCENQRTADERIPILLQIPAAVRFVSLEPLLGEIELDRKYRKKWNEQIQAYEMSWMLQDIDWVIAGCESGPGRRPSDIDCFRSLRDQCQEAGVPFFLKQMEVDGKIIHMPELDGKVWDQMPGGSSRLKAQS